MSININEIRKNKLYNELAERRTIEKLGLSEKEVIYAKAFETTKTMELYKILDVLEEKDKTKKQNSFLNHLFFGRLY